MFSGCVIAVSDQLDNFDDVVDQIDENGGIAVVNVNSRVTHICCEDNDEPMLAHIDANGYIHVLPDDLQTCIDKKQQLKNSTVGKRARADDDDDDDDDDDTTQKPPARGKRAKSATATTTTKSASKSATKSTTKSAKSKAVTAPPSPPRTAKVVKKGRAAVDPGCPYAHNTHVYEEGDTVWTATLNQTNLKNNNNKFYIIQLLEADSGGQYRCWNHWGRVGATGQNSTAGPFGSIDAAKAAFKKKFREKTKNAWEDRDDFTPYSGKYTLLQIDYDDGDDDDDDGGKGGGSTSPKIPENVPKSKLHPKIQSVVEAICDVRMMNETMKEMEYDIEQMPLGKLKRSTLNNAYSVLREIEAELKKPNPNRDELMELSSQFYTYIPHVFGMRRPPTINTAQMLKTKLQMLEALGDIEIATTLLSQDIKDKNPIDAHYDMLKCGMEVLDHNSKEFKMIRDFVTLGHGKTHNWYSLEVVDVFDLARHGEKDKFEKNFGDLHNQQLLWHGSRKANFVGILSQGLRIAPPEAPCTGYMFGKGAYFADIVSKSANYCHVNASNPEGFMLLCQVALGNMEEHKTAYYTEKANKGFHSVKGLGRNVPDPSTHVTTDDGVVVPVGKPVDKPVPGGSLLYNEYIVYDTTQIRMRYLLKLRWKFNKTF